MNNSTGNHFPADPDLVMTPAFQAQATLILNAPYFNANTPVLQTEESVLRMALYDCQDRKDLNRPQNAVALAIWQRAEATLPSED